MTHDGGLTWTQSKEEENTVIAVYFDADGKVAWSLGDYSYRSTDGALSFTRFAAPQRMGIPVLLGAQPSSDTLFLARMTFFASPAIVRLDTRTVAETIQPLSLDGGHAQGRGSSALDAIAGGTFVPGEPTAICLGIMRTAPYPGLY